MEAEIVPEPSPTEREAILAALDAEAGPREPASYRSAWRREALGLDEDE